ncbi:MAG: aldo/keto reductase [Deltaproteobacteria bacterium]|nr:aldo/keto reductase [Deltaproteobacteria bacterium]
MVASSKTFPRLGLGGGALGSLGDNEAFRLLDAAVDFGITLVDVARSYGDAEARVGRWRKQRPGVEIVVVTKGGYGSEARDWTGAAVAQGIDGAVALLGTVDAFLLHSCTPEILSRDDVGEALLGALRRGQVGAVGYSGDNDDLHAALDRARDWELTVIEASLSLLDGKARVHTLPRAAALGMQVIAKRALANCPWLTSGADGDPADRRRQHQRFLRAGLPDCGVPFPELFLRFAAWTSGVSTVLIGTRRVESLRQAVAALAQGPLPDELLRSLAPALSRCDQESLT